MQGPETYYCSPTPHVPNSSLPVLVYRSALPSEPTEQSTQDAIEKNQWLKGGTWKTYWAHHFHSVTHECYAVFKGRSRLLLGKGPLDTDVAGVEVEMNVGDVIVLPAGVAHCSISGSEDYEYVGLYPAGSPKYDNNWCKAGADETAEKAAMAASLRVPEWDPIFGKNGPLCELWNKAATA